MYECKPVFQTRSADFLNIPQGLVLLFRFRQNHLHNKKTAHAFAWAADVVLIRQQITAQCMRTGSTSIHTGCARFP